MSTNSEKAVTTSVITNDSVARIAPQRVRLQAYSSQVKIDFEALKTAFMPGGSEIERYNRDCLILHRGDSEKVFIFRFGTAVFMNVPLVEHEYYLTKLGIATTKAGANSSLSPHLAEDEFLVLVEAGPPKVNFNGVTLPDLDLNRMQIVAQVLAQSSALEIIEKEVDAFLVESENVSTYIKSGRIDRGKRETLMNFIGAGLSARHRIVNTLSLLKEPEKTWDKEDLYLLFKELFTNFEIEDRIEKVDRMFKLSSEASELLLDIVHAKRSEFLEIIIIVLIAFEIVKSFT